MNILMVGFYKEEKVRFSNKNVIMHTPYSLENKTSPREYRLMCRQIVESLELLIINLNKRFLTLDECYLLFDAYSSNIPILGVGESKDHPFVYPFISNQFKFMDEVNSHIKEVYGGES